jgi:hypothetical protein
MAGAFTIKVTHATKIFMVQPTVPKNLIEKAQKKLTDKCRRRDRKNNGMEKILWPGANYFFLLVLPCSVRA